MIDLQNDGHDPIDLPGLPSISRQHLRDIAANALYVQIHRDLVTACEKNQWVVCRCSYRDESASARDMVTDTGMDGTARWLTDCQLEGWIVVFRRQR